MTNKPLQLKPRVLELIGEAAQWRLIGLLLECPGDGWQSQVAAVAEEVADPLLREAATAAQQEAGEGLYHTTFGPGGPAAPREVSYRDGLLFGKVLAEVRGHYEAFAYRPSLPEAPDHVAVEAGFVGYLRFKEAYALACGQVDEAEIAAQAAHNFVAEHLAMLAEPLARSLEGSGIAYLSRAGQSLLARVGPRPKTTGETLACVDPCDCDDLSDCSTTQPK